MKHILYSSLLYIIIIISGCSGINDRDWFFVFLKNIVGLNFDHELDKKALSRNFAAKMPPQKIGETKNTILYLVVWWKDCTYVTEVHKSTRVILNARLHSDSQFCRQQSW